MARGGNYIKWLIEEDIYCVERFIENYFEKLIKTGRTLTTKEMEKEVNLYNQIYFNKRTTDSVRLKFHNIEHLAFKWIDENGNPYNIQIKERMSKRSKQCLNSWLNQLDKYANQINEWLQKNNPN